MGLLIRLATSRIGIVCIIAGALFLWHKFDKSSAVRRAVAEYVAAEELAAVNSELRETQRRAAVTMAANERLRQAAAEAEEMAATAEQELEAYVQANPIDPDCVVDDAVIERMRHR